MSYDHRNMWDRVHAGSIQTNQNGRQCSGFNGEAEDKRAINQN